MTMHPTPSSLDRLRLDEIDWSRCSGRDLHRLAEGAAQAAMRRKLVGPEGLENSGRRPLFSLGNLSVKRGIKGIEQGVAVTTYPSGASPLLPMSIER